MTDELGLAILYGILSVTLLNVGLGTQKYGLSPSFFKKIARSDRRKTIRGMVWLTGAGMTVAAFYLSFKALAIGRISLIAALGGIGLIALALFSFLILKEKMNNAMLIGMALIGVGTTLFGLFTREENEVNIDLSGLTFFIVAVVGFSLAIALISVKRGYWYGGVIFGTVAGVFGGIGTTLQKCSVASGEVSLQLLTNMFFYGSVIASGISFLVTQFALTKGTAISVVPSYNSTMVVLPQIGAMLIFTQFLELVQWLAVAILVVGIVLLTRFKVELPKGPKLKKSSQNTERLTKQRQGSKAHPQHLVEK